MEGSVQMAELSRIEVLLQELQQAEPRDWRPVVEEFERLAKRGLTAAEGMQVLRAAAFPWSAHAIAVYAWPSKLVQAVVQQPRLEYPPLLVELYPQFEEGARRYALWVLNRMEEREAAVAYMEILRAHARSGDVPRLI